MAIPPRRQSRIKNGLKSISELPGIRVLRPLADILYIRVARTYKAVCRFGHNAIPLGVRLRVTLRPPATVRGVRLRIRPTVSRVMRQHIYEGNYEKGELDLIDQYLEPQDRVMELGGGLGVISTFCARRVGSRNVITYEGNPALESYILETWASNEVNPKLVPALMGTQEGQADLYLGRSLWGATMVPRERDLDRSHLRRPVRAFNKERQRFDPTFVVMDIEGSEYDVVQGAEWGNVRGLVMELHPWYLGPQKAETVKQCLVRAGFKLRQQDANQQYLYFSRKPA